MNIDPDLTFISRLGGAFLILVIFGVAVVWVLEARKEAKADRDVMDIAILKAWHNWRRKRNEREKWLDANPGGERLKPDDYQTLIQAELGAFSLYCFLGGKVNSAELNHAKLLSDKMRHDFVADFPE